MSALDALAILEQFLFGFLGGCEGTGALPVGHDAGQRAAVSYVEAATPPRRGNVIQNAPALHAVRPPADIALKNC
jgi:hypothetical protein